MRRLLELGTQYLILALLMAFSHSSFAQRSMAVPSNDFHVPAVDLPPSQLMSADGRLMLEQPRTSTAASAQVYPCGQLEGRDIARMRKVRNCLASSFYASHEYRYFVENYPVDIESLEIDGVYVEIFTPKSGILEKNRNRVLINVHGAGFASGSRTESRRESMPIAALGGIKVISIDYRMGPEFHFPAATQDVDRIYRHLLRQYQPRQIGIFGCSAGALLTAQSIAWFSQEGLPRPGAIAMLSNGAANWLEGDSGRIYASNVNPDIELNPYFKGVSESDPLAFPIRSDAFLAKFPPSLLIAGSRDFGLSSVVATHSRLVSLGVDADLHIFEGLEHGFHVLMPKLPESKLVYRLVVDFFDKKLAN